MLPFDALRSSQHVRRPSPLRRQGCLGFVSSRQVAPEHETCLHPDIVEPCTWELLPVVLGPLLLPKGKESGELSQPQVPLCSCEHRSRPSDIPAAFLCRHCALLSECGRTRWGVSEARGPLLRLRFDLGLRLPGGSGSCGLGRSVFGRSILQHGAGRVVGRDLRSSAGGPGKPRLFPRPDDAARFGILDGQVNRLRGRRTGGRRGCRRLGNAVGFGILDGQVDRIESMRSGGFRRQRRWLDDRVVVGDGGVL